MEKFCSNCSRKCAENDSFCPVCGTPLVKYTEPDVKKDNPPEERKIFCTNCGGQCNSGDSFCPNCGSSIDVGAQTDDKKIFPMFIKDKSSNSTKKIHPGVKIGIIIFIIIAIAGGIASNFVGQTYTCKECEKTTSEIYYDFNHNPSLCEDCAEEYWFPHDYKEYRVK